MSRPKLGIARYLQFTDGKPISSSHFACADMSFKHLTGPDADEEDFLAIIVANETVLRWQEKWVSYEEEGDSGRAKLAVLVKDIALSLLDRGEAYVSEAVACGMAQRALSTLKRCQDNPEMMDDLSTIIVACSGPSAQGDKVTKLAFGGVEQGCHYEIIIKEGALADGVGAKLWRVARIMCERMVCDREEMIRGKTVLEVGAGVGACGFLASKLGASSVVISDYVDKLLLNLREALGLNMPDEEGDEDGWTRGCTSVRFIDWEDSVDRGDGSVVAGDGSGGSVTSVKSGGDGGNCVTGSVPPPAALDGDSSRSLAPVVEAGAKFQTIIGTDVLYEWPMVNSLSSCIKERLAPNGTAYICNAVRDQEMFDALIECIRSKDLAVEIDALDVVTTNDEGWCQEDAYEGGFVFVRIRPMGP